MTHYSKTQLTPDLSAISHVEGVRHELITKAANFYPPSFAAVETYNNAVSFAYYLKALTRNVQFFQSL